MTEDEPFLRAILAQPDDLTTRLVYADWLVDRADPRAEYVRLSARVAELPFAHADRPALREQMFALQAGLPSWWLAIIGFRATAREWDPSHSEDAAQMVGRPSRDTINGETTTIEAAAVSPWNGTVAWLESRWKQRDDSKWDVSFALVLRDSTDRITEYVPGTHNAYMGNRVMFLEWYGESVVLIFWEFSGACCWRFALDSLPTRRGLAEECVIEGRELLHRFDPEPVYRLSLPDLCELPQLTGEAAREVDSLFPA